MKGNKSAQNGIISVFVVSLCFLEFSFSEIVILYMEKIKKVTNFFSTDCEILFRTSRTHTFQVLAGFCTGQLPFTFQVVWLRQKVTLFSKSDYKLGTLIKSITDVWFILDMQPFFSLCDKNLSKNSKWGRGRGAKGLTLFLKWPKHGVCFLFLSQSTYYAPF